MKFILFVVALLLSTHSLSAQVLNVEQVRTDSDTTGWVGELGFDLSINKFNDRVFKSSGQANSAYFTDKHQFLMISQLDLVNVDGNSLISNGYVHLRSTLLRKENLSPELFTQYQYNENLGLQNRALAGAGIRYTFLSTPKLTGRFSTGIMFEHEEWGLENDLIVNTNYVKSTNNLVVRGELTPDTSLQLIGYYQARYNRFFEPRVTSENQLNMKLTQNLTFRVSFTLTYDVEPVIDVPNLTYELKNGLVFSI